MANQLVSGVVGIANLGSLTPGSISLNCYTVSSEFFIAMGLDLPLTGPHCIMCSSLEQSLNWGDGITN